MPIPFRDAEEVDDLGAAAFLSFVFDLGRTSVAGGILLVDARAEPFELAHQWMALPRGALWSAREAWHYTGRRLAAELFGVLGRTPAILLVQGGEVAAEAWLRDLEIGIPTGFVEAVDEGEPLAARWLNGGPALLSTQARLYERLACRGLLGNPFDRVVKALNEFHPILGGGLRE